MNGNTDDNSNEHDEISRDQLEDFLAQALSDEIDKDLIANLHEFANNEKKTGR